MDEDASNTALRVLRGLKTPLTLITLVILLVVGFQVGYKWLTAPPPPPQIAPCVPQPVTDGRITSNQVTVRVFNAGGKRGLAADVTRALDGEGFAVAGTGNFDGDAAARPSGTRVVGAAPDLPEVQLVARFFKDAEVTGDGRPDRSVEVLLGEKYAGMNEGADNTIPYGQSEICLPELVKSDAAS